MKSTWLAVPLILLSACLSLAQSKAYQACMDKAMAQSSMNACAGDENKRLQTEQDRVYQQLLKAVKSDSTATEKIKKAQDAWLAYKQAYLDARYPEADKATYGSIYPMDVNLLEAKMTRQHIADLKLLLKENSQ
jgi:uncharacterized protein YecT (DUF1311 family)